MQQRAGNSSWFLPRMWFVGSSNIWTSKINYRTTTENKNVGMGGSSITDEGHSCLPFYGHSTVLNLLTTLALTASANFDCQEEVKSLPVFPLGESDAHFLLKTFLMKVFIRDNFWTTSSYLSSLALHFPITHLNWLFFFVNTGMSLYIRFIS